MLCFGSCDQVRSADPAPWNQACNEDRVVQEEIHDIVGVGRIFQEIGTPDYRKLRFKLSINHCDGATRARSFPLQVQAEKKQVILLAAVIYTGYTWELVWLLQNKCLTYAKLALFNLQYLPWHWRVNYVVAVPLEVRTTCLGEVRHNLIKLASLSLLFCTTSIPSTRRTIILQ